MKLTEMSTEQVLAISPELAVLMGNILEDPKTTEDMTAVYNQCVKMEHVSKFIQRGMILRMVVPGVIERNKEDAYKVLSLLTGKTVDELKNQNAMTTMREIRECVDDELLDFFGWCGDTVGRL